ncbi:MAG: hypothetical protein IKJ62_00350, partial [Alphaproteobacteria bacterium]|nr:hypothetical protein [Alphaproteobacteria bacterium]
MPKKCESNFWDFDFVSNQECESAIEDHYTFTRPCPTSHPYSDAGATDIAQCYTGCGTGYSGGIYYNGTNTCSCDTLCTSVANRETRSGSESCTRSSCSIDNGTCSYSGSTQTYTDTCASNYTDGGCQSAGESCSGCSSWTRTSTGTCSGGTISITCNAGYYLSNGTCVKCSAGTYSAAGATSCTPCGTGEYSAAGASSCSTCPSGYRDGAAAARKNDCVGAFTKTGQEIPCPKPANYVSYVCGRCTPGTCTYYENYAGKITQNCDPADCTTPVSTLNCQANYYRSGGTCQSCPSGYPNSERFYSDDITDCYSNTKSRAWTGSQTACSKPSGCASVSCNTCSIAACDYVAYSNSAGTGDGTIKSGCSSNNASCQQTVKSVTASANYYVSGTTCPACSSYSSTYTKSDGGSIGSGSCYTNITRGCTQNNGSTPSGCASVTAWNACSCAGTTYKKYASGSTSGTTSNETCTKTPKTVTASANYYVSGTTCPACSSFSSTYPKSDGGNITSGYCYRSLTNTGSQLNPPLPTGCAAQSTTACTPGTCTYKDYYSATDTTCTPANCTKTHASCTSASANYYLASGVAKTCSSYSSSYPSSAGGNITSSSCYGSFSKSGSQLACSQPANSASYTCGSCTVGTCNYTKYASGTIKTDCT